MRHATTILTLCAACAFAVPAGLHAAEPWTLTTPEQENKLGEEAYKDILKAEKVCKDKETIAFVQRVADRITKVAPDKGFKYEVTVLESDKVNAFCLPGGKIAVYTGILPYAVNEAGLATVMGHEVAHAILRHGGQRMTQATAVGVVGAGLEKALQIGGVSGTASGVAMGAYGYGTQLGILLPYGRDHEREADIAGLEYLAKAGYDPAEAPAFWERFSELKSDIPTFLSTHPGHEERAARLKKAQPEAMKWYEKSPRYGKGELLPGRYLTKNFATSATSASGTAPAADPNALKGLNNREISAALREALSVGARRAGPDLAMPGAIAKDPALRIRIPENLKKVEKYLKDEDNMDRVEDFLLNANKAAEAFAPKAARRLDEIVARIAFQDPRGVLAAGGATATQHLKAHVTEQVIGELRETMAEDLKETGAKASFAKMMKRGGDYGKEQFKTYDLEAFIARATFDALFVRIGQVENAIRLQPESQPSESLRKVFGAAKGQPASGSTTVPPPPPPPPLPK
ncbi:MAG: DUF4197 family protein [Planctomycetes bacterium]|nr:DUF4197 family protein [Planctomycetota bacterium]